MAWRKGQNTWHYVDDEESAAGVGSRTRVLYLVLTGESITFDLPRSRLELAMCTADDENLICKPAGITSGVLFAWRRESLR